VQWLILARNTKNLLQFFENEMKKRAALPGSHNASFGQISKCKYLRNRYDRNSSECFSGIGRFAGLPNRSSSEQRHCSRTAAVAHKRLQYFQWLNRKSSNTIRRDALLLKPGFARGAAAPVQHQCSTSAALVHIQL
jgi:hypothetical protein